MIESQNDELTAAPAAPIAESKANWLTAVRAAQDKKAQDIIVLDLRELTSLTDFFVICTGTNIRQNQAISDEVHVKMKEVGERALSVEGYDSGEWVLMDYGDFILHIFVEQTRTYYDLERLWRHARRVEVPAEPSAS